MLFRLRLVHEIQLAPATSGVEYILSGKEQINFTAFISGNKKEHTFDGKRTLGSF